MLGDYAGKIDQGDSGATHGGYDSRRLPSGQAESLCLLRTLGLQGRVPDTKDNEESKDVVTEFQGRRQGLHPDKGRVLCFLAHSVFEANPSVVTKGLASSQKTTPRDRVKLYMEAF